MDHEEYMRLALDLAREAFDAGEVPVGCVVVKDGQVLGAGRNMREEGASALLHAEAVAIHRACQALGDWRLEDCALYVTLEPCLMCAGAIVMSRVPAVYYGAKDPAAGACGSILNVFEEGFGHRPKLVGGILAAECGQILTDFFKKKRKKADI